MGNRIEELESAVDVMLENEQTIADEIKALKSAQRENDDRMLRIEKRGKFATGGGSMIDFTGDKDVELCKSILPDDRVEYQLKRAEYECETRGHEGLYKTPGGGLLRSTWFLLASQLQAPRAFTPDPRAAEKFERVTEHYGGTEYEQKASLNEGTGSQGGYLVPTMIANEVQRVIQDHGAVTSRARHVPMLSNDLRLPAEDDGVEAYWTPELTQTTSGEPTFSQRQLIAKRLTGRAVASIESVEDAAINVLEFIQITMAERFARLLDIEALEGTTNFSGVISETGINEIQITTSGAIPLDYSHLVQGVFATEEQSATERAVWFMNRTMVGHLSNLTDSTGRPLFQPSLAAGVPPTLMGYELVATAAVSSTRQRDNMTTSVLYFCDPRRLIFGDRAGLRFDVTDTGPNYDYYALDMRMVGRWGFVVGTPAACTRIVGAQPL